MTIRIPRRRGLSAAAIGMLSIALAAGPAAAALPETEPTAAALDWIQSELSKDGVFEGSYPNGDGTRTEYVDHGTTIDAALADAYLGRADSARAKADALEPVINDYLDGFGKSPGAYAKTLALLTEVGGDVNDFNGNDVLGGVESEITESGPTTGRLQDTYVNAFSQALAVRGLREASSPKAGDALGYLLQQQCPGGGFPLYFPAVDAAQGCDSDESADPDATGFVVTQLVGSGFGSSVTAKVQQAADWLTAEQAADGSLSSADGANSNSTGLAGWALGATCRITAAQAAGSFVRSLQVPADEPESSALSDDSGAIAFTADSLESGRQNGIDDDNNYEWRKATTQAAPALQWLPGRASSLRVSSVPGYKKAGTRQQLTITGAEAGEPFCIEGPELARKRIGAVAGSQQSTVRLPEKTGFYTYTVSDGPGSDSTRFGVLGPKRLRVAIPAKRPRGTKMRVYVRGLASGERASLRVSRGDVRTKYANRAGRVVFYAVPVKRPAGLRTYVVKGKFGDIRRGSDTIRVTRR